MSKIHISEIADVVFEADIERVMGAIQPDCSFSLDDIDYDRTLGMPLFELQFQIRMKGMLDIICKGRCENLPIRIYPSVLLNLAKKDVKDINLILIKKRKYFHIEEVDHE